ncbi:MAG: hypothetical protein LBD51_00255 [Bifidobacteriaceae bacterium]|nr:hypothetical protein [Bifidobacteriaceae bacterium]
MAQGLVEAYLRFGVGVAVDLEPALARDGLTPFEALFSESQARAPVALAACDEAVFAELADGTACPRCGWPRLAAAGRDWRRWAAAGGDGLALKWAGGEFAAPLAELHAAWEATLLRHFGS